MVSLSCQIMATSTS